MPGCGIKLGSAMLEKRYLVHRETLRARILLRRSGENPVEQPKRPSSVERPQS